VACSECKQGEIVEKRSRKGIFYGCNRYPDCKMTLPSKPVGRACPNCGQPLIERVYKGNVTGVRCPNKSAATAKTPLRRPATPLPMQTGSARRVIATAEQAPRVVVLAGPNGAGKSTAAPYLLPANMPFVNADEIAKQLPASVSGNRDMEAGRILLGQLDQFEQARTSFAVETTLASRSLAPRIARLREAGYRFLLFYLWLPAADLSIERVAARVRRGGHNIPSDTIRRRYQAGLHNFFTLYRPLADRWRVYQNISLGRPELIASGGTASKRTRVQKAATWKQIREQATQ
jgi:predicted ABC-type ATPase